MKSKPAFEWSVKVREAALFFSTIARSKSVNQMARVQLLHRCLHGGGVKCHCHFIALCVASVAARLVLLRRKKIHKSCFCCSRSAASPDCTLLMAPTSPRQRSIANPTSMRGVAAYCDNMSLPFCKERNPPDDENYHNF